MRIVTKFVLLFLALLLIGLVLGGIITYQSVKKEVTKETDFSLREEVGILVSSIEEGKPIDALQNRKIQIVEKGLSYPEDRRGVYRDTLKLHIPTQNMELFRSLTAVHHIDSAAYEITITDVFMEEEDMLGGVISTMLRLFLAISLLFIIAGFFFSKILMKPFEKTLNSIEKFEVSETNSVSLSDTSTKEFNQLHLFLESMMKRATSDYRSLKEFSENASHEVQTPLAVVKGKLELLQSKDYLKEKDLQLILESQGALRKVSKLVESLGLLTKLENKELLSNEEIDISKVVHQAVDQFREWAVLKEIDLDISIKEEVKLKLTKELAEILVGNLIKNAVIHNHENGKIKVTLDHDKLEVVNTGKPLSAPTSDYFNRFKKDQQSSESLGLGLSIVKKITEVNDLSLDYTNEGEWHRIRIGF